MSNLSFLERPSVHLAAFLWITLACGLAPAQDINVAPAGTVSQSSEYNGGQFPATNAIDGDTGNFTHTSAGVNLPSTWQDDLGTEFPIKLINLYNRGSCCALRLRDITVTIFEEDGTTIAYQSELLNPEDIDFAPAVITLDLEAETGGPVDGRIISVAREPDPDFSGQGGAGSADDADVLSLGEVEIMVDPSDVALRITRQPVGARLYAGDNYTLSVTAFGAEPLSYQWKKGVDNIPGATTDTLFLQNVKAVDAGIYTVVVSNGAESVTSDPADVKVPGLNLALYGTATQSTTLLGAAARRANDGNVSGDFLQNSVSQTRATGDPAPWWEVALPATSTVEKIVLWNRTDCCSNALTNFRVLLLNAARVEVLRRDFFTDGVGFPDTTVDGLAIDLPVDSRGRFVRIERLGPDSEARTILALAEVEVFGTGQIFAAGENLARRRSASASQSSDHNNGQFPASFAVDGDLNNFTHTAATVNVPSWWQVDLGDTFPIGEVLLHNRLSCCGSRLRDITVLILDAPDGALVYASELLNEENVLGAFPTGPPMLELDLVAETGGPVNGRVVRIERTPDDDFSGTGGQGNADEADVLSLGEVEVFPFVECPELGDTHCSGVTVTGPDGGGPGDYEVAATGADDSNDAVLYTFTAMRGAGSEQTLGPQPESTAVFNLGIGTWTISVKADDSVSCDDEAADSTCSTTVTIEGCGNVAQGAEATQSSEYGDGQFPASNALNGNLGDFTHTGAGLNLPSTWEVDLGAETSIESIVLHNRADCCGSRLRDITVTILSQDGQTVAYQSELLNPENEEGVFPNGPPMLALDLVAETGGPVVGGRVRVEREPDPDLSGTEGQGNPDEADVLSLAEVEVLACEGDVPTSQFHRGDADDNGALQLTDALRILGFLFLGQAPPTCLDAGDADDNGSIQLTDALRVLGFLFLGQAPPAPPGPPTEPCGVDPSPEDLELGCETYTSC